MSGFPRWLSDAQGEVRLWNGGKVPAEDDGIVKLRGSENPWLGALEGAVASLLPSPEESLFAFQDNENIVKILKDQQRACRKRMPAIESDRAVRCHESVTKMKETPRRDGISPQSSVSPPGPVRGWRLGGGGARCRPAGPVTRWRRARSAECAGRATESVFCRSSSAPAMGRISAADLGA